MSKTFKYKDYVGSVDFNLDDDTVRGKIEFINDLVTYQAQSIPELRAAFEEAVDDYLETCEMLGREPQKSLSGTFNVRVGSDMHKQLATAALKEGVGLNDLVKSALSSYLKSDKSEYHVHFHQSGEEVMTRNTKKVEVPSWVSDFSILGASYHSTHRGH